MVTTRATPDSQALLILEAELSHFLNEAFASYIASLHSVEAGTITNAKSRDGSSSRQPLRLTRGSEQSRFELPNAATPY